MVILLFGGAWINRAANVSFSRRQSRWRSPKPTSEARETSPESIESGPFGDSSKDALLGPSKGRSLSPSLLNVQADPWRKRELSFFGWHKEVISPNTAVFENRLLSRVLRKFPFLVECWYWALIYWVGSLRALHCQLAHQYVDLPTGASLYGCHSSRGHSRRCS